MASSIGRTSGLDQRLFQHPEYFEFFQITRLLEQAFVRAQVSSADDESLVDRDMIEAEELRLPLGYDAPPDKEVVRFRSTLAAAFPGTEVDHRRAIELKCLRIHKYFKLGTTVG